jgi:hypothetical protein
MNCSCTTGVTARRPTKWVSTAATTPMLSIWPTSRIVPSVAEATP